MIQIEFTQDYPDVVVGRMIYKDDKKDVEPKLICKVALDKARPFRYKGKIYKLEGRYKLSYRFREGRYMFAPIVNNRSISIVQKEDRSVLTCRLPCLYLLTKRNKANWTEMCRNLVAHDQMSMLVIWAIKEWHDECFFEVPNKGIDDDFIDEDDDDDFE